MKREKIINLGHYGWSKSKCPKCGGRLRLLRSRAMRVCKSRGKVAGNYSCYVINMIKRKDGLQATVVSMVTFNTEQFSVIIRPDIQQTQFRHRDWDNPDRDGLHIHAGPVKTFDKILSYREVLKWEKAWVMQ